MRRHSRKKRSSTPYTILIYNILNTKSPRHPEGGGFRDPSGFAALRIDMNCVVSHNIKRRERLLKQICRYSVGNLPTPAMTHANLSDRYGNIPLCERQPENRSRIPFRQQRKRIRPYRKTSSSYCECAGYTKKNGNFRKEICRCDTQSENHGKKPVFSICFVFEMTWDETEYHKAM